MSFTSLFCCVLFFHWVADFICQTRWMADNKSKCWSALCVHVMVYTAVLGFGLFGLSIVGDNFNLNVHLGEPAKIIWFLFLNMIFHWMTDGITSKITSYFWSKQNVHAFFCTVGFDQMIHTITLLYTSYWLFGG